jgi:hypothetical protein
MQFQEIIIAPNAEKTVCIAGTTTDKYYRIYPYERSIVLTLKPFGFVAFLCLLTPCNRMQ